MYKLVLIEDEPMLRQGLELTIPWAEHGYEVVGSAGDASEGERVILQTQPDLVITDIRLPQVSGLDLIESLSEKIVCDYIVISGYDDFSYAKRAIYLGVKAYLLKPIDDCELLRALEKVAQDIARRKGVQASVLNSPRAPSSEKSLGERYLMAAVAHIHDHYKSNITLGSVADALCISESYLTKLFKRLSDRSFLDILTQCRMKEAARLLEQSTLKVYEVANQLCYQDTQHFSNLFRKATGVCPSDYKQGRR